jgi:hypothetical protein
MLLQATCSARSSFLGRVCDPAIEQLSPHWTVTVTIELDVPLDIVDEMAQGIIALHKT